MTLDEVVLLSSLLRSANSYVEFGCGGSTALAAELVRGSIVNVDSSPIWHEQVRQACAGKPVQPTLLHADIGPTGDWGYPIDPATRDRWPRYHSRPWVEAAAIDADLYLIDGRFRIACCMQTLLRCRADSLIAIHDYRSRPAYHVVERFMRPIVETADLTAFHRRTEFSPADAAALMLKHAFDPA